MSTPRDPLVKERFLQGNRQRWAVILLLCAGGLLVANMKYPHIEPEPFLTFLMMVGCVFLGGMSLDAYAKIKARERLISNGNGNGALPHSPKPEGETFDLSGPPE